MQYAETVIRAEAIVSPPAGIRGAADDPAWRVGSALAISGGRIIRVGEAADVDPLIGEDTVVHDYPGGTILPGLTDAHTHPVWGSQSRGGSLALGEATTLAAVQAALAPAVAQLGDGEWLSGFELDPDVFAGEPSGRVFEEWFPGIKISLMTRDAHALVVSPAVIAAIGLTGAEEFADASRIATDEHGPTGWVIELQAMDLVLGACPQPPLAVQAAFLLRALTQFAAEGLTAVHALDFHDPSLALYRLLETRCELPVRVRCSPLVPADSPPAEWQRIADDLIGLHGRRWEVAGVKFMLDGTADNGTAWFEEHDVLGENHAALWNDPAAYREAVRFFTERDIPTTTHAIGDHAVRFVLETVAEIGHPASGPHRIEHIESIPDSLLDSFAALGVVAGLQPTHCTRLTSPDHSDGWSQRIGPERVAHGWRIHDLLAHGATVALSSDWPIGISDPRVSLADAQLRRPVELPDQAPSQPQQRISAAAAYTSMTLAPAIAEGAAHERGSVNEGFIADLTVFARNPLALDPTAQASNPVLATYIDGTKVTLETETP